MYIRSGRQRNEKPCLPERPLLYAGPTVAARRGVCVCGVEDAPFLISFSCRVLMSFLDQPKGSKTPPG